MSILSIYIVEPPYQRIGTSEKLFLSTMFFTDDCTQLTEDRIVYHFWHQSIVKEWQTSVINYLYLQNRILHNGDCVRVSHEIIGVLVCLWQIRTFDVAF